MIFYSPWWRLQNSLILNSNIQSSFKKCSLIFDQAEMVFVIVWFLDHFTLKPVPSNNVIFVNFLATLFNETQHVVKTSTTGYVPICYKIRDYRCSSLSLKICCWWAWRSSSFVNSRAWTRFVRSSIFMACNLSLSCCQTWGNNTLQQCLLKSLSLTVDLKITSHTPLPHWCKYHIFANPLANWLVYMQHIHCSFDTFEWYFLGSSGPLWCLQSLMYLHHIPASCTLPWHVSRIFH